MMRIETGPVQFGDDWPGTFIRGDNAAYYAMLLKDLLELVKDNDDPQVKFDVALLQGLVDDLVSSDVRNFRNILKLRPIEECNGGSVP